MSGGCFWADDPFALPEDDPDATPCPTCGTPIEALGTADPDQHVAVPCGCPVPGDVLEG
ncbi:hypothetical protein [Natrarchaeobaculum aegyptiacum]|uniref:hypothetical protein n=1 Tax=Natrarchaeobaculum aegyptiacum TaxID=745377 RepID=UPI0013747F8E|nr:hypothetical protein [Natrarchaeobaculum aegyptiacum]